MSSESRRASRLSSGSGNWRTSLRQGLWTLVSGGLTPCPNLSWNMNDFDESIAALPALLDLQLVASFLGQPLNSVRRWIHRPPEGFPKAVRLGTKITFRKAELVKWANGDAQMSEPAFVPLVQLSESPHVGRRGRPRNTLKNDLAD